MVPLVTPRWVVAVDPLDTPEEKMVALAHGILTIQITLHHLHAFINLLHIHHGPLPLA